MTVVKYLEGSFTVSCTPYQTTNYIVTFETPFTSIPTVNYTGTLSSGQESYLSSKITSSIVNISTTQIYFRFVSANTDRTVKWDVHWVAEV